MAVILGGCWGTEGTSPPTPSEAPRSPLVERIDGALHRASRFLVAQQGADGAFRSSTYGAFKDGYSLTPLAVNALLFAPPDPNAQQAYRQGSAFIATVVMEDGALRSGLEGPTYPLYAIAGGLLVLNQKPAQGQFERQRQALVALLRERQMTEERGWNVDDPAYGGWGYHRGIPHKPKPGQPRSSTLTANLSATLFAVGALRLSGVSPDDPAMKSALQFVERCQNVGSREPELNDGGFVFSPELDDGNKAGPAGVDAQGRKRFRSYGSMTADGVRALVRLGRSVDHPRVKAAAAWLANHFEAERNPGTFPERDEVRRRSSYFYYVWSVSHALRLLGETRLERGGSGAAVVWPEALAEALLAQQRDDGSWANTATEMREDDPLIATSFAMAGLAISRMVLTSEWRTVFGN